MTCLEWLKNNWFKISCNFYSKIWTCYKIPVPRWHSKIYGSVTESSVAVGGMTEKKMIISSHGPYSYLANLPGAVGISEGAWSGVRVVTKKKWY